MTNVIDTSNNELLEDPIEYANDDVDLLELAMILLEQMDTEGFDFALFGPENVEVEAGLNMLPMLAYTA